MYVCIDAYMYIYIYIERERERERPPAPGDGMPPARSHPSAPAAA